MEPVAFSALLLLRPLLVSLSYRYKFLATLEELNDLNSIFFFFSLPFLLYTRIVEKLIFTARIFITYLELYLR